MSAAERKKKNAHGYDLGVITWGVYEDILGYTYSLITMVNEELSTKQSPYVGADDTLDRMRDGLDVIVNAIHRAQKVD